MKDRPIVDRRSYPSGSEDDTPASVSMGFSPVPDVHRVGRAASRFPAEPGKGLFVSLLSVHGLIRGRDPELGRDADTGGQVLYVLDLARALSHHPGVDRVELMTRQILSTNVSHEYGEHLEQLTEKAWIVRIPFGPHRYLHKESLWPYLPQFVDNALLHYREIGRVPDVFHGHYPDAGEIASRLGRLLGTPVVYTGHSLGRIKRQRLLEKGLGEGAIERRYNIGRRIGAEESVLEHADLVIASTRQEAIEQYALYEASVEPKIAVIPPGVNLDRFRPPRTDERFAVAGMIDRFLADPEKPMILAVQRADERKNLSTLIRAFGERDELRERANLVLFIGARDDIRELPKRQRTVLNDMLLVIDRYDLYGSVAYPKTHTPEEVAEAYRLATQRGGVFVNPAVTEPFGLTLIEAAASGLPVVATNDGGPQEIVATCHNGLLVDPLDAGDIAAGLLEVLSGDERWQQHSRSGIAGADANFSWNGHVLRYLARVREAIEQHPVDSLSSPSRMVQASGLIVCDIDNTLTGDREALEEFVAWLLEHRDSVAFGVATGRVLPRTHEVLEEWSIPLPDILITAVGSEIYYGRSRPVEDLGWRQHIDHDWQPEAIRECLGEVPGLELQPARDQRDFKLSYFVDPGRWPGIGRLRRELKGAGLSATTVFSHQEFLDLLPIRASKGGAVRHLVRRWGFASDNVLAAGDSGNDAAMLKSVANAVVVGNFSPELKKLDRRDGIYFAEGEHAAGILEGIEHFGFPPAPQPARARS